MLKSIKEDSRNLFDTKSHHFDFVKRLFHMSLILSIC